MFPKLKPTFGHSGFKKPQKTKAELKLTSFLNNISLDPKNSILTFSRISEYCPNFSNFRIGENRQKRIKYLNNLNNLNKIDNLYSNVLENIGVKIVDIAR